MPLFNSISSDPQMKPRPEHIYIFLHIPKTAGTTFRHHIENNFPEDETLGLYKTDGKKMSGEDVFARISALPDARKKSLRVVYGHEVYYGIHELLSRPSRYITFFRDPIEKTVSFYNYRMQQGIKKNQLAESQLPCFDHWLSNNPGMHDGMFGDLVKYGFAAQRDASEPALRALFGKFYFVGTTETFDEDAMFLYHQMGIRRFFRDQNKSQRFLSQAEVERIRPQIAAKTPLDRDLYAFAMSWNRSFKKDHPDFASIVKSMRIKRTLRACVPRLLPA